MESMVHNRLQDELDIHGAMSHCVSTELTAQLFASMHTKLETDLQDLAV